MRIWNGLMIQGHPRGAVPLVGRQLYYLVKSEHGWLGGLGFSSSALHLEARDQWIGWDWDTRRANLHNVVNLSPIKHPQKRTYGLFLLERRFGLSSDLIFAFTGLCTMLTPS